MAGRGRPSYTSPPVAALQPRVALACLLPSRRNPVDSPLPEAMTVAEALLSWHRQDLTHDKPLLGMPAEHSRRDWSAQEWLY